MNNRITELEINNFKSIKHIKMDCKRINVLIGKPNVGKSNILEALSFYNAPYNAGTKQMLGDYIRYEKLIDLFYDLEKKNTITVKSNLGFITLKNMLFYGIYEIISSGNNELLKHFDEQNLNSLQSDPKSFFEKYESKIKDTSIPTFYGQISNDNEMLQGRYSQYFTGYNLIKKYQFKRLTEHKNHFPVYLSQPHGDNLFTIIENNRDFWDECADFFNQYGLDLLVDQVDEKLEIQKKIGRYVTKIPYSLAADTLQRIIFHLAAIETNKDSILLFEEPESHSYPPYISMLAERIIESDSNQFFIATHSPYLLTPFLEKCSPEDISIFIARYENYETKIKALSEEEINNIKDTGIDLFYNIRAFEE